MKAMDWCFSIRPCSALAGFDDTGSALFCSIFVLDLVLRFVIVAAAFFAPDCFSLVPLDCFDVVILLFVVFVLLSSYRSSVDNADDRA